MYGVIHMDASGEDNPPIEILPGLYDELFESGVNDGNVAVVHDDSHWCMSAYRDGRLVFGRLGDADTECHMASVPKSRVIEMWKRLIAGDVDGLLKEPWTPGYGSR